MKRLRLFSLLILVALILAACASGDPTSKVIVTQPGTQETGIQGNGPGDSGPETNQPTPESTSEQFPIAIRDVIDALARQNKTDKAAVQIKSYEKASWPDACLGLPSQGVACAEVITPGYTGQVTAAGEVFEFRVDELGETIHLIPSAALRARQTLAQQQQLEIDQITFTGIARIEWPDACLGAAPAESACAQVITPGYKVDLEVGGVAYEFHTDLLGGMVMAVVNPEPDLGDVYLTWEREDTVCQTAQFYASGVAFGTCDAGLRSLDYISQNRALDLAGFVTTYAPFEAETPAGKVKLNGQGVRQSTQEEQRMLAEWARLGFLESQVGQQDPTLGLAFTWHKEGGIAGFCDDVNVYVSGEALGSTCRGAKLRDLGRMYLNTDQLTYLYRWLDRFKSFEYEFTDTIAPDGMTTRLIFSGTGQEQASNSDQQFIIDFAADLFIDLEQEAAKTPAAQTPEQAALQALENYFAALNARHYDQAARLYGGSYEILIDNNPELAKTDFLGLFKAACELNGFQCSLRLGQVVQKEQISASGYLFTVELKLPDGGKFELGPCCGANPTDQPPVTQFQFTVKKVEGLFLVLDLPVYGP